MHNWLVKALLCTALPCSSRETPDQARVAVIPESSEMPGSLLCLLLTCFSLFGSLSQEQHPAKMISQKTGKRECPHCSRSQHELLSSSW